MHTLFFTKSFLTNRRTLLLLVAFAGLTSIGRAQVLITDNFNRGTVSSPVVLNGSSPTFASSPETWMADSSITTDGTQVLLPNTGNSPDSSVLGYIGIPGVTGSNLNPGTTYNLSFTFTQPANTDPSQGWTAAGFGTFSNTADAPFVNGNSSAFFALDNGTAVAFFDEVGGMLHQIAGVTFSGDADVVLTIQAGVGGDTMSATINGATVLSPTFAADDPMTEVFVGDDNDSGTIKSLSLDEVALPEPSTYAMLLGGAGMLFFVLRRRNRSAL